MAEHIIELKHVNKEFDGVKVVDDVNLYINKGEFVTILGPSGCGKTTTLRMIAGFEMATSGEILLNGVDISNIPPHKRPINTVFQRYALFPHLDVYDNVAFLNVSDSLGDYDLCCLRYIRHEALSYQGISPCIDSRC